MAKNTVSVKNLKTVSLKPKVSDPEAARLLPTRYFPVEVSLELHGVNLAIANGIRRVLCSEYPTLVMNFAVGDFSTNNPSSLVDYVRDRIRNIPVDQSVNPSTVFRLNVLNETTEDIRVKSRSIESGKTTPFNETFDIAMLSPGKFINIQKIYLEQTRGWGGGVIACNCVSTSLDETPIDLNTGKGTPSSLSDPHVHRLSFVLNGTVDYKTAIRVTCDEIISRLNAVIKLIPSVTSSGDMYYMTFKETDTIGNILLKGICEAYPEIPFATYNADPLAKTVTLKIKTNDDIEPILIDVCKRGISVLDRIKNGM